MTSRKRRAPAALVRRAAPEGTGITSQPRTRATVSFVVPDVTAMLQDLKFVVGSKLKELRQAKDLGDGTGQLIRNLSATLASVQETERKAADDDDLANLTPAELVKRLRAEADAIEGRTHSDATEDASRATSDDEDPAGWEDE